MIELKGKHNTAKVFTDNIEPSAIQQIEHLLDQEFIAGSKIRIMPDVHFGMGCTIGTTMTITDKIVPNLVGVDIGCGMRTVELGRVNIDLEKLDDVIKKYVPSGRNTHEGRVRRFDKIKELNCYRELSDARRLERSIGTLGGGNHFIELGRDEDESIYLVIHSGSRNLGKQVAEYYQKFAYALFCGKDKLLEAQEKLIAEYKAAGRKSELTEAIKKLRVSHKTHKTDVPKDLAYLTGKYKDDYMQDMMICQEYAIINRETIADIILEKMQIKPKDSFETIHNYIDIESLILRKGAVSARKGERILIPMNMRDGSLICVGKGNSDWNFSAPHGAGRIMSRTVAKNSINFSDFEKSMKGIFSSTVNRSTLDEAPFAYKPMDEIIAHIGDTAEIKKIIRPLYNFKAAD
ncbi:MAG: RtcB family protein [Defluviitaleaceae bacterium]|nr:RtcB family protein [Defluviitaleaceae bacterium]